MSTAQSSFKHFVDHFRTSMNSLEGVDVDDLEDDVDVEDVGADGLREAGHEEEEGEEDDDSLRYASDSEVEARTLSLLDLDRTQYGLEGVTAIELPHESNQASNEAIIHEQLARYPTDFSNVNEDVGSNHSEFVKAVQEQLERRILVDVDELDWIDASMLDSSTRTARATKPLAKAWSQPSTELLNFFEDSCSFEYQHRQLENIDEGSYGIHGHRRPLDFEQETLQEDMVETSPNRSMSSFRSSTLDRVLERSRMAPSPSAAVTATRTASIVRGVSRLDVSSTFNSFSYD